MDAATKAERRRQGLEDSVDLSQDSTRVAKRAGRINAAPRNVFQDASGRRVVGPTSAQIGAGRANPAFYANKQRADNIAAAKAAGTFAQTRLDYNKANEGKSQMDDAGNITPVTKPAPELEAGSGSGSVRVKKPADKTDKPAPSNGQSVPMTAFDKPSPNTSKQTPSKPDAPKAPTIMGPTINTGGATKVPIQQQIDAARKSVFDKTNPTANTAPAAPAKSVADHAKDVEAKHSTLFRKPAPATPTAPRSPAATPEQLQAEVDADPRVRRAVAAASASRAQTAADAPKIAALNEYVKDINAPGLNASLKSAQDTNSDSMRLGGLRTPESTPMNQAQSAKVSDAFDSANKKYLASTGQKPASKVPLLPSQRDALKRAKGSSPILSAFNPTQHLQGGKSSLAGHFPGMDTPDAPTPTARIMRDKALAEQVMQSGQYTEPAAPAPQPARAAKEIPRAPMLVSRKDGGRINPFKCGGKMKPMMLGGPIAPPIALASAQKRNEDREKDYRHNLAVAQTQANHIVGRMGGGVVPGKVVPGAVVRGYAEGGEVEENNEVTMVGEEGPELLFKRKDGSMFVTPADVSSQIIDGIEMEDTDENAEAMDAAKKRIKKTQVKPKMLGGTTAGGVFGQYKRPNPFDTSNLEAAKKASMLPGGPDPMQVYGAEQWGMAQKQAAMAVSPSQQLAQRQGTALNGAGQPLNPFRKML